MEALEFIQSVCLDPHSFFTFLSLFLPQKMEYKIAKIRLYCWVVIRLLITTFMFISPYLSHILFFSIINFMLSVITSICKNYCSLETIWR